ncbi:MAG: CCA tRNA nucleotidyltransferase [Firmicutes bacterium]|nr:CCA tRNA nucleotidyltransferase [Candidatus Fiminaster equi]
MNKTLFTKLVNIFKENGYRLYMIGGTTRDYLLGLEVFDYDFVTDATPEEIQKFLPDAEYHFAKFGSVKVKVDGTKVDVTTLRVEDDYEDFRHPGKIRFVKTIEEDYVRRDFTINAIYIDEDFNVIDPSNGLEDLKNKTIRFIGDPEKRIKEDPLRILRAKRFAEKLGFKIEEKSQKAIGNLSYLLDKLNPDKIKEEERKSKSH